MLRSTITKDPKTRRPEDSKMKRLLATLLLTPLLTAQPPVPATRTLPLPCAAAESAARPFFSQRSFVLLPEVNCPTCFIAKTSDLHDEAGHRVSTSRAMHLYIQPTSRKSNAVVWYAHSSIDTLARLTLTPDGNACRATLLFTYTWYEAKFLTVVPANGEDETRPSNLRLENLYLDQLAKITPPPQ
jgi:hypothetical protein